MNNLQPLALSMAQDLNSFFISEEVHATKAAKIAAELIRQHWKITELEKYLQFCERWAVHHGIKPHITAQEALSVIQHHPAIRQITESYEDGRLPETFNPYARITELEAQLKAKNAEQQALRGEPVSGGVHRDTERLDFMIESGAVVCTANSNGQKYLTFPNGDMQMGDYTTPRAAIDAAIVADRGE